MPIAIVEFGAVAIEVNGRTTIAITEPPIRTTVVTPANVTRHVTMTGSTRFIGLWPSSGGDQCWYNAWVSSTGVAITSSLLSTLVVSPGFPERKIVLTREGDYEIFGAGPYTIIGIRGS